MEEEVTEHKGRAGVGGGRAGGRRRQRTRRTRRQVRGDGRGRWRWGNEDRLGCRAGLRQARVMGWRGAIAMEREGELSSAVPKNLMSVSGRGNVGHPGRAIPHLEITDH